jgi:DNA invertase Pin-like site-specific DNA recombinase
LQSALRFIREGDVLVVYKLDRLGRSLKHLIEIVTLLKEKNIGFKSLSEGMDTTTTGGQLVFTIFAGIAEFERAIIRERTLTGLAAAKARGRLGGRKLKLSPAQVKHALNLYFSNEKSVRDICSIVGISRGQFYEYLKKNRNEY